MKSVHSLLFLSVAAISLLSNGIVTSPVFAHVTTPDRLEILRTVGHSHSPAHEMVTQPGTVQELYLDMISLPAAPPEQICPQYIIANYQLTFFAHNIVVQRANALRGMCQPVTLGSDDIRTADTKFWGLMGQALAAGKALPTSTGGNLPSTTNKA